MDNCFYKIIGKNIAKYRNFKELTQEELADMIGSSQSYINSIENSKENKLSLEMAGRIADNLNIPIKLLFDETNNIELINNYNSIIHSSDYFYEIFRLNLRRYRKALNISQEELASKINIKRSTIGKIESPKIKKHFTIALAYKISKSLKVSMIDLFNEDVIIKIPKEKITI